MPAGPIGEPIEIIVFGAVPPWLGELAEQHDDIRIEKRARLLSAAGRDQVFRTGSFIWTDCDLSPDIRLELLDLGAGDVWSAKDSDIVKVATQGLDRLRRRRRLCGELQASLGLLGSSPASRRLREEIADASMTGDVPVLLLGATGSGKMHAARALHAIDAARSNEPAATLDCGTASDEIFASDLFGHLRGSFTGADKSRDGAIVTAGNGYLVLDEIGELSPRLQVALLGVLQEMEYKPVGSDRAYPVRCRIVSLTNRPLPGLVEEGAFRRDLYHRLDGILIQVPSLAQRRPDIPAIFRSLVAIHAKREVDVDPAVDGLLQEQSFPGNVRQLEMTARIAVAQRADPRRIRLADLPRSIRQWEEPVRASGLPLIQQLLASRASLDEIVAACSTQAVELKLEQLHASFPDERRTALVKRVAEQLKISERTVYNRLNGHASA